jgi:dipeptidyl-peptidase 4
MADTFPRQQARTQRFTLGIPRAFRISPDGSRIVFLRSRSGTDPVSCLWRYDVETGQEHLIADPAQISPGVEQLDPAEKARRERARERAGGIVGFATDEQLRMAAFVLSGQVYLADLTAAAPGQPTAGTGGSGLTGTAGVRAVATPVPAADPRPDPRGQRLAYLHGGALRVTDLATGEDQAIAEPGGTPDVSFGIAEFIAAEEMHRMRGYWWAPDGSALLIARVDESPVQRWYIADPANPDRPPAQVRYPAAGTPNADVSLLVASLAGGLRPAKGALIEVDWDRAAFPYLATALWDSAAPRAPLIVLQTRDQREMRMLSVDPETGATSLVRADTDPHWLEIVPGVPARTSGGRIVWTADSEGARRLLIATADELAAGTAEPVTPTTLQVREILSVAGDTVLFAASAAEPTEIGLWTYGPDGLAPVGSTGEAASEAGDAAGDAGPGPRHVQTGRLGGGALVIATRTMESTQLTVRVLRDGKEAGQIAEHAERPLVPDPHPVLLRAGEHAVRTALLLPSWHRPGSGRLPVLLDPYGGPHAQLVLASRSIFLTSQWLAEQGFAVVIADGRGTPGRGPQWERAIAGEVAGPVLADQVDALREAAARCPDLDTSRVAIRGWSFGGYLAALAVLRRPDVFHAAIAGAPVTDWRLYDTHYTERYLGHPDENPHNYERTSLIGDAARLSRPLLLIHGLADDNVVVANTLRLSGALLAAGKPHSVLPLSGVTHMASQEEVAENLLLLQVDFLRGALGSLEPRPPEAR